MSPQSVSNSLLLPHRHRLLPRRHHRLLPRRRRHHHRFVFFLIVVIFVFLVLFLLVVFLTLRLLDSKFLTEVLAIALLAPGCMPYERALRGFRSTGLFSLSIIGH